MLRRRTCTWCTHHLPRGQRRVLQLHPVGIVGAYLNVDLPAHNPRTYPKAPRHPEYNTLQCHINIYGLEEGRCRRYNNLAQTFIFLDRVLYPYESCVVSRLDDLAYRPHNATFCCACMTAWPSTVKPAPATTTWQRNTR